MSKSLGNFFTIRDVMEKFHPEVIPYQQVYGDKTTDLLDETLVERFNSAMRDDFNTSEAIATLVKKHLVYPKLILKISFNNVLMPRKIKTLPVQMKSVSLCLLKV
ncbi:unnamed protein product [Oppiella nova]|uniref:Cysteinyl-tRNA synthetase class Ia DALR domain-containing protein n=1 Tax=Oppiella nova TaxID=334625 RepID=A0A7R9Q9M5_9ACAR|nr:unnamed protein product [Oppiella nova]CAG2157991.1 unnamed protein product [Oppiella nova]